MVRGRFKTRIAGSCVRQNAGFPAVQPRSGERSYSLETHSRRSYGTSPRVGRLLRRALLIAGLAVLAAGCRQAAMIANDPTPNRCAECHIEIAQQWETSGHARAWTDEEFAKLSEDKSMEECLPCHAPSPVLDQQPLDDPELREHGRDFGVDCATCHAKGCGFAGSYRSFVGPHGTEQTTRLASSEFCGTCHRVEYDEFLSFYVPSVDPYEVEQCIDCHMPAYKTRLTQGHALSLIHPKRIVRDHSFPIWTDELIEGAIEVGDPQFNHRRSEHLDVAFTLTNRGAGHRIPTGGFGHRELRIVVELLDSEGDVLGSESQSTYLKPKEDVGHSFSIKFPAQRDPVAVRLLVERVNQDRTFRRTFIDRRWPIGQ